MIENQYRIFKASNKFVLTANMVIYTLLFVVLGTAYLSEKYWQDNNIGNFSIIIGVLTVIAAIIFAFTGLFTRKTLRGKLEGVLVLKDDSVIIDNRKIDIGDIDKIDFIVGDYLDRLESGFKGDFNPKRSNGVYNYCKIELSNGEKINIQFQLLNKNDFDRNRDCMISFYKKGRITFMRLIHILNIESYGKIQEFKSSL